MKITLKTKQLLREKTFVYVYGVINENQIIKLKRKTNNQKGGPFISTFIP